MPVVEVVFGKGKAPRWSVPGALQALAFSPPSSHLSLSNLGEGTWALMQGLAGDGLVSSPQAAPFTVLPALGTHSVGWRHRTLA